MVVAAARWRAIGTNVDLLVRGLDLTGARAAVERVIADADAALSSFRDDSELSVIQRTPGLRVAVSQTLARALDAAFRAALLTDGLVDPTVGRVLRLAGYDRDFAFVRDRSRPPRVELVPGWRAVEWRSQDRLLRLPRGIELDFGSTGKALVVDDCAAPSTASFRPAGARWCRSAATCAPSGCRRRGVGASSSRRTALLLGAPPVMRSQFATVRSRHRAPPCAAGGITARSRTT